MSNAAPTLGITALLFATAMATAQDTDISHQRKIYQQTNDEAGRMEEVTATSTSESGRVSLTGWRADGELRKITASPGISGPGFDEFYLEHGKPIFLFSTLKKDGEKSIEERIYLAEGKIVKWLSTDPTFVAQSEDEATMTKRITTEVSRFAEALDGKKSYHTGRSSKAQGVFTGIEEGDYAHWKLRAADGTERSFFILQTNAAIDRVLADPQEYEGRSCVVSWARRTENLPEAGAPMEIDVLLGVEWR